MNQNTTYCGESPVLFEVLFDQRKHKGEKKKEGGGGEEGPPGESQRVVLNLLPK